MGIQAPGVPTVARLQYDLQRCRSSWLSAVQEAADRWPGLFLGSQGKYDEADFEYEEKIDLEKTKKLFHIRTNLCVISQVRTLQR